MYTVQLWYIKLWFSDKTHIYIYTHIRTHTHIYIIYQTASWHCRATIGIVAADKTWHPYSSIRVYGPLEDNTTQCEPN